jgi:hypothetical protein
MFAFERTFRERVSACCWWSHIPHSGPKTYPCWAIKLLRCILKQKWHGGCSRSDNHFKPMSQQARKETSHWSSIVTFFSVTLSACQKPCHGKSWRQMPLMLFRKIAMALPSHSTRFTTLLQEKRSISLPTSYPYCATEQLHGPAQLSLKGCIPLVTAFFHRGASLDRMVSSWISSLHSRAVQEFSLAIWISAAWQQSPGMLFLDLQCKQKRIGLHSRDKDSACARTLHINEALLWVHAVKPLGAPVRTS